MNNFLKNGFIIEKLFDDKEIKEFENSFLKLCKMQIKKLNLKVKSNNIQNNVILLEQDGTSSFRKKLF